MHNTQWRPQKEEILFEDTEIANRINPVGLAIG
jgi:hypothetical protein